MQVSLHLPGSAHTTCLDVSPAGRWDEPKGKSRADIGDGWWALPGLVDAHAHLAADRLELLPGEPDEIRRRAYACLEKGTFLVVEKGWCDHSVLATLTPMAPDAAPDIEGAGRMIAVEGGYYSGFAVETDAEGLGDVVRRAVTEGKGWVKLIGDWPRKGRGALPNFSLEALTRAVQVAHGSGARVAIHTMAPEVASWAVAAGIDSIEHGLFLTGEDLELLGRTGGAWVPTVLRMEAMVGMLGGESSGGRLIREGIGNITGLLSEVPAGVSVLTGTDLATGPGEVAREVTALVRMGLAPERAVDSASVTAHRYLGRPDGFGVGDPANAVFFDSDPYQDPAVLERPVAVLRSGKRLR